MDLTLAKEDAYATEIAFICLGFKRPTRLNVIGRRSPFPPNMASWLRTFSEAPAVDKPQPGDETSSLSIPG
jgi:hypothetical protein